MGCDAGSGEADDRATEASRDTEHSGFEHELRYDVRRDAPSARLSPISRVRSSTEISITVRIPMAPSISPMLDTAGTS